MEQTKKMPTNIGESISVLFQVAELAQKSGILNLEDATIVKVSMDIIKASLTPVPTEEPVVDGPVA